MNGIDLDLVDLRCKLRGWRCVRDVTARGEPFVDVHTPQRSMTFFADGITGYIPESVERILTRPRLTLEDIVASPPEGWRCVDRGTVNDDTPYPVWSWVMAEPDEPDHIGPSVEFARDGTTRVWLARTSYGAEWQRPDRLVVAHRAVADLLVLLGEVEL